MSTPSTYLKQALPSLIEITCILYGHLIFVSIMFFVPFKMGNFIFLTLYLNVYI